MKQQIITIFFLCIFSMHTQEHNIMHQAADHGSVATHMKTHYMPMHGMYGHYSMEQECSGTSWQPVATPWHGFRRVIGPWHLMVLGFANFQYDKQGGPRGGSKLFSTNMEMFMAQRDFGGHSTLAFRTMFSLDAAMGKRGYPLLFQTGETADGVTPLVDRQHPHDLFMELAGVYRVNLTSESSFFAYFGLPGEPALGPPVYFMRYTGTYIPETPLGHHWLDSTHIQFGVATVGLIWKCIKIDSSIFTGREPDQYRFDFERPRFDSWSIRGTCNPTDDVFLQISFGMLKNPEQIEPDVSIGRTTASIAYNKKFGETNWQSFLAWGRNRKHDGPITNAYLFESVLNMYERYILFTRAEHGGKDELFPEDNPLHDMIFNINKITLGGICQRQLGPLQAGIGALASVFPAIPEELKPIYNSHPFSYMIFMQIRLNDPDY